MNSRLVLNVRPDKPEAKSELKAWLPTSGQKSHGKLALSMGSRSGVFRANLSPNQVRELGEFLLQMADVLDTGRSDD